MTYVSWRCPGCGSDRSSSWPAVISPFVASYALDSKPNPTRLCECEACGLRFFEDRLTEAEAGRLYSGYRGDAYFEARHRHEPWYSRKINDAIGGSDEVIRVRCEMVERFIKANLPADAGITDVLDFGGDRGQLIPQSLGDNRFVYEISGVTPVSGVTCIASAEDLAGRAFDLVLVSHVLEHCSEPRAILDEVRPLLRDQGVLYVELPYERAQLRWLGKKGIYRGYLDALRRVPLALRAMDLYSTAFRLRFNVVPPLGFVKMHEHINFFDERSLRAMLEACGLEPMVVATEAIVTKSTGTTPVLCALARRRR